MILAFHRCWEIDIAILTSLPTLTCPDLTQHNLNITYHNLNHSYHMLLWAFFSFFWQQLVLDLVFFFLFIIIRASLLYYSSCCFRESFFIIFSPTIQSTDAHGLKILGKHSKKSNTVFVVSIFITLVLCKP